MLSIGMDCVWNVRCMRLRDPCAFEQIISHGRIG